MVPAKNRAVRLALRHRDGPPDHPCGTAGSTADDVPIEASAFSPAGFLLRDPAVVPPRDSCLSCQRDGTNGAGFASETDHPGHWNTEKIHQGRLNMVRLVSDAPAEQADGVQVGFGGPRTRSVAAMAARRRRGGDRPGGAHRPQDAGATTTSPRARRPFATARRAPEVCQSDYGRRKAVGRARPHPRAGQRRISPPGSRCSASSPPPPWPRPTRPSHRLGLRWPRAGRQPVAPAEGGPWPERGAAQASR